jgi:penicillin-binding protein 1A
LRAEASLALGTSEVTPIELTAAYGVLANGGRALEPHLIRRVRTGTGSVLFERRAAPAAELVAPAHVAAMNDMLNAVLVSGTGKRAALPGVPAAGKTGTSQDFRDAWFVGYTEELVAGVWVGNDDGRAMNKVMGGSLPARLWHDVMLAARAGEGASATALAARDPPGEPRTQPLMPRERIGTDFVDRLVNQDRGSPVPTAGPQAERRGWLGTAKDLLRRGLSLVM